MKKTIIAISLALISTQSFALGLGNDNPIVDAGVNLTVSPELNTNITPTITTSINPTVSTNIAPTISVNPNVVVAPTVSVNPKLKLSTDINTNISNDINNNSNAVSGSLSNSNSTSNSSSNQSQSNDNSNSNNSSQSVTVQGDSVVYKQARIPVASALAPTNLPTALCMGSSSAAVQSTLLGFSLGSSWTDKNCMVLEQVRSASTVLGDIEVAEEIMCSLKEYKEARARVNRPCK